MGEQVSDRAIVEDNEPYEGQIYGDTDGSNSYRVDFLIELSERGKFGPVIDFKLAELLVNGRIEGDSDEPDDSEHFFKRVQGLTLEQYQQGEYPPILVGKRNDEYHIIDGRHRAVNLLNIIQRNALDLKASTIKSHIIDFDDPQQMQAIKKAKIKNWR